MLKQKDPDPGNALSAIRFLITQIAAFFIVAESFQFSRRGDTCSSYRFRTFIREQAGNKEEAIGTASRVSAGGEWRAAMLTVCRAREQQNPTFLAMVLRFPWHNRHARSGAETGVRVFQFPQGVIWGEGRVALRGGLVLLPVRTNTLACCVS